MKHCIMCGKYINDDETTCQYCGAEAESDSGAKKICKFCKSEIEKIAVFCPKCGGRCNRKGGVAVKIDVADTMDTVYRSRSSKNELGINTVSLILIIICAILWIATPFIAINYFTLGNQPTALQFLTDDITYIGDLTETTAYWAAVASLIGIIVCFICTICKKNKATRIIAILTEIPLTIGLFEILSWADDFEEIIDALGIGFWGMFILFFAVIIASGSKNRIEDWGST